MKDIRLAEDRYRGVKTARSGTLKTYLMLIR